MKKLIYSYRNEPKNCNNCEYSCNDKMSCLRDDCKVSFMAGSLGPKNYPKYFDPKLLLFCDGYRGKL